VAYHRLVSVATVRTLDVVVLRLAVNAVVNVYGLNLNGFGARQNLD